MATRTITIEVDELDEATILNTIAKYQAKSHAAGGENWLPEGESDIRGATLAEICRAYQEYHDTWKPRLPLNHAVRIKEAIERRIESIPGDVNKADMREVLEKFIEYMT